jgi:crotonobetainyl-CoA:carnitine CoA-transferase CaiB-like acyl-CoA transferase
VCDGSSIMLASGPVGCDGRHAPAGPCRASLLGEHTDEILEGIGYAAGTLARLKSAAVIR